MPNHTAKVLPYPVGALSNPDLPAAIAAHVSCWKRWGCHPLLKNHVSANAFNDNITRYAKVRFYNPSKPCPSRASYHLFLAFHKNILILWALNPPEAIDPHSIPVLRRTQFVPAYYLVRSEPMMSPR